MGTKISAMNVGTVTSSTPFPAVVGSTTRQVTLEPVFNALSTIQTTLGTLQSTITSVAGSVTTLSGTVTTLSGTVSTMQTDIATLQSTAASVASQITGNPVHTALDQSSWSWVTQVTTSAASASVTQSTTLGTVYFEKPGSGAILQGRVTTVPATPWTLTAGLQIAPACTAAANVAAGMGIGIQEAGSSKLTVISARTLGLARPDMSVETWTRSTLFSGTLVNLVTQFAGPTLWFRITDDGTNLKYLMSPDGTNFFQVYSELRGTFFSTGGAPTHLGFFSRSDTHTNGHTIVSWKTS